MTYSIVARDGATGELGVAVQTCHLAVGAVVPWTRPGVGVVATQAIAEPAYGPRCLDALSAGMTAPAALAAARAADPRAALRQVGVVGADGSVASFTGGSCIDHAGQVVGDGFAVQANMVGTPRVWSAMASAFEASTGPLAHRLLSTLVAGEQAGGDARGRMSAALVVVEDRPPAQPGAGTVVDLRVDRSADPLGDLAELLDAADGFAGSVRAVNQLLGGDPSAALATIDHALETLPGEGNLRLVRAGALLGSGATEAGVAELRGLVAEHPTWEVVVRGFVGTGLLRLPDGVSIEDVLTDRSDRSRTASVRIERLRAGDDAVVHEAGELFDHPPEEEWTQRFLTSPGHHLLVAFDDDDDGGGDGDGGTTPVGFVSGVETTHPDKGTELFLYELATHEDHRRRGVGRALVAAMTDLARARGCYGIWVSTEPDNVPALATYRAAGFDPPEAAVVLALTFDRDGA